MEEQKKSPREEAQDKIVEFLEKHEDRFNAPYGIISGLDNTKGKGKIRSITFGVSRYLDAIIRIFTPTKISVDGQGGLAYKVEGNFSSADDLINHFTKEFNLE